MINLLPDPWNFSNDDICMLSPSGKYKIEYGNLTEFGQGSPLQAALYVKNMETGKKAKIFELAGGPPVWNNNKDIVAVPVWWRGCLYGNGQKLLLINLESKEFVIFKKRFRLLDLKTYAGGIITGFDSPLHKPKALNFDTMANKALFKKAINQF